MEHDKEGIWEMFFPNEEPDDDGIEDLLTDED